jgi:hypothetical protein
MISEKKMLRYAGEHVGGRALGVVAYEVEAQAPREAELLALDMVMQISGVWLIWKLKTKSFQITVTWRVC